MFSLPYLDEAGLSRIGIWEAGGRIVALATYEMGPGDVWFSLDPEFGCLNAELLHYACNHLAKTGEGAGARSGSTSTVLIPGSRTWQRA